VNSIAPKRHPPSGQNGSDGIPRVTVTWLTWRDCGKRHCGTIAVGLRAVGAHSGATALALQHLVAGFWEFAPYQLNVFSLT
jgi:hypothetical protein